MSGPITPVTDDERWELIHRCARLIEDRGQYLMHSIVPAILFEVEDLSLLKQTHEGQTNMALRIIGRNGRPMIDVIFVVVVDSFGSAVTEGWWPGLEETHRALSVLRKHMVLDDLAGAS